MRAGNPAEVDVTVGLVIVANVTLTTLPLPEDEIHDASVPSDVRNVLFAPMVVRPVPPEVIGRAVPDKDIASVPLEVIGEPKIDRNAGTVAATEVTVPVPGAAGVCQTSEDPLEVRTWFVVPIVVRPVPPDVVGRAVPDKDIASVPLEVIGEPKIDRNAGTVAATEVTVPPPPGLIVVHDV